MPLVVGDEERATGEICREEFDGERLSARIAQSPVTVGPSGRGEQVFRLAQVGTQAARRIRSTIAGDSEKAGMAQEESPE